MTSSNFSNNETSETLGLRDQAAALPLLPGVYLFKDGKGTVLYVGKAIRLKERVRSYFAPDLAVSRGPALVTMVEQAVSLDHEVVGSEPEALLLEARLIRKYKPRYNIKLTDDKSYMLVSIDFSHPFPVLGIAREKDLEDLLAKLKRPELAAGRVKHKVKNIEYYGPFPSLYSVKGVLKTIRQIWPYRDCSPTKYAQFERLGHGCIFASLGLCTAPCAGQISVEDYGASIAHIRQFLRGERGMLITEMERQMNELSQAERYEEAALLRDRLFMLRKFQYAVESFRDKTVPPNEPFNREEDVRIECFDISNNQGEYAVGSLICGVVKGGKTEEVRTADEARKRFSFDRTRYRKFRIRTVQGISDVEMLQEVLRRRLRRNGAGWEHPDLIILDGGKGQMNAILPIRNELDPLVAVSAVSKGPTRRRTDLIGKEWDNFPSIKTAAWHRIAELLREEAHRFAIGYYRHLHRKGVFR